MVSRPGSGASTPDDLAALTLSQASQMLRAKKISPIDLTQACLKRIARFNGPLNAYITVTAEAALSAARAAEAEQHRGHWKSPLHGIPISVKDNIDTAGIRTTAASAVFKDRVPSEDAEAVRRLKAAGAVILGKNNLQEFAAGGTSAVSYFGAVHNPWAFDHIAGGSSGGSAAATAADLCFASLGTDNGGSVRIPASYCGVVGFKPTYGRVSLRGVMAPLWSLDHVGPICKSVEDAALMLAAVAGYDQMDPASLDKPVPDYGAAFKIDASKLRWGVPRAPFFDNLDPEVAEAVGVALDVVRKISSRFVEATLPATAELMATIINGEFGANHAKQPPEVLSLYQPRIRAVVQNLPATSAAAYAEALKTVTRMRREMVNTLANVDVLITPTMPNPPETLERFADFNKVGLQNTGPFDVLGLPTISVPCGFTKSGLPIGLQISGAPFAESTVLAMAHAYERETQWHKRRPALTPA